MSETQSLEEITAIIEQEKNAIQLFLEILGREEEALTQGRINDLDMLLSDKTKLFHRLEEISDQRSQYLSARGYPVSKIGMQSWLADQQKGTEICEAWEQLLALARQAQQINQINGKAISMQLQYNQRSYLALQSAAGNISLYGPKGQAYI